MQRLQTREQFQAVMATGIVSRTSHFALHRGSAPGLHAAWGALVPKRWARRAVTRNAIKRQIYAMSAQRMSAERSSPDGAVGVFVAPSYVVRLRAAFDRKAYPSASSMALRQAVHQELVQLLRPLDTL